MRGGPGSSAPGLATFENVDLFSLVTMAYGLQRYQLSGPEWLGSARFEINARLAPGTTREQYRQMLQSLLAERFQLTTHSEQREIAAYELILSKGGSNLKPSSPQLVIADDGLQPPPLGGTPPPGYNGPVILRLRGRSMEEIAALLASHLGRPVIDNTGLTGRYDLDLRWSGLQAPPSNMTEPAGSAVPSSEPTLFDVVQQLGLKLVPKKFSTAVLVIDHIAKTPREN